MSKQVIFNLPVKDLEQSKAFFRAWALASMPRSRTSAQP